jgi:hypothetical protein
MRPIISSRNSLGSGIESYLLPILSKFKPNFKFRLENMTQFKNEFLDIRDKINLDEHTIVSYVCSHAYQFLKSSSSSVR